MKQAPTVPPPLQPKSKAPEVKPLPLNMRAFLLRMLATIFAVQAVFIAWAFAICGKSGNPSRVCPDLGSKTTELFGVAVATTLSLLTGAAVEANRKP